MQTDRESAGTMNDDEEDAKDGGESLGTRAEIEVLGGCKRRIKASVPAEKVREELDRNYKELASTVRLPGFRPGRVPRKLLEARFGEEIEGDVKQALLSGSLAEVVEEEELHVVGSPKFDEVHFESGADLSYTVELEVRPELELIEYSGIEVVRETVPVKDEDVDERLKSFQRKSATLESVDPSKAGLDGVYIGKYSLYRDGAKVKTGVEASFTPSSKVFHNFLVEDLPERVKAWEFVSGAPLKLPVKLGADYPDEVLRGAEAELEFVLEETQHVVLPELNDEFSKTLGKDTIAELKAEVRKSMEDGSVREEDRKVENRILEKLVASTAMDLPEGLIESISNRRRLEREYELLQKGMAPELVKEALVREGSGSTEDVRREMKEFFILEKIADKEKVFATEEEVDKRLYLMASLYGIPPARFRDELRETGRLDELRLSLRNEKVRAFLRKRARIVGADGQAISSPESSPISSPESSPLGPPEGTAGPPEGTAADSAGGAASPEAGT